MKLFVLHSVTHSVILSFNSATYYIYIFICPSDPFYTVSYNKNGSLLLEHTVDDISMKVDVMITAPLVGNEETPENH